MIFRRRQILQEFYSVVTQSLLHMRLTCCEPLLHAPTRENGTNIISGLIFLERRGRRDITLARTNSVDFIEAHVRVVKLESACEAQSLVNDLMTIDKGER